MTVPQNVQGVICFCLNFILATLRISSISRCRHVMWFITAGVICETVLPTPTWIHGAPANYPCLQLSHHENSGRAPGSPEQAPRYYEGLYPVGFNSLSHDLDDPPVLYNPDCTGAPHRPKRRPPLPPVHPECVSLTIVYHRRSRVHAAIFGNHLQPHLKSSPIDPISVTRCPPQWCSEG